MAKVGWHEMYQSLSAFKDYVSEICKSTRLINCYFRTSSLIISLPFIVSDQPPWLWSEVWRTAIFFSIQPGCASGGCCRLFPRHVLKITSIPPQASHSGTERWSPPSLWVWAMLWLFWSIEYCETNTVWFLRLEKKKHCNIPLGLLDRVLLGKLAAMRNVPALRSVCCLKTHENYIEKPCGEMPS